MQLILRQPKPPRDRWIMVLIAALLTLAFATIARAQEFVAVTPVRTVNDARLGEVLSDIESQMPAGHIYRDADLVTWAHETTHGINSRLRNATGGRMNAFYCLNGRAVLLRSPAMRKSVIARYVPAEFRGGLYASYVVGMPAWDDTPLYVLDEWIAYTNGAEAGVELASKGLWRAGDRSDSIRNMLMFNAYATALLIAVEQHDPTYADKQQLAEFIGWNLTRTFDVAERAKTLPAFYSARQDQVQVAFLERFVRAK